MPEAEVRCLLVIPSFSPREGGVERQFRQLLNELPALGVRVTVLTNRLDGVDRKRSIHGATVVGLGSRMIYRRFSRLGQLVFGAHAAFMGFKLRPQVVVTTNLGSASLAGHSIALLTQASHVVRLTGGGAGQLEQSEILRRRKKRRGRLMMRLALSQRALLVAPAEHLLEAALEVGLVRSGRTAVIPNGVSSMDRHGEQRKRQVVWYGREGGAKNWLDFRRVAEDLPEVNFVVIGKASAEDIPAMSNVKMVGWIDSPEELLARSKVVLSTSLSEGSPNLCLQALAVGARVVGYNIAGLRSVRELAPDGTHLAEPGDTRELGRLVRIALDSQDSFECRVATLRQAAEEWAGVLRREARRQD